MTIWKAIRSSFVDIFEPKILIFVILTPIFSLLVWGLVFFFFAWQWAMGLSDWLIHSTAFQWIVQTMGMEVAGYLPQVLAVLAIVLLFLPLTYFSTVILISIFGMPIIVRVLKNKYYGELQLVGASGLGSIGNTIVHSLLFLLLFFVTLPLWLLPGMQIFVPILLTAAYNRRIFSYDSLGDFLSHKEIKNFQKKYRSDLLLLGIFIATLAYLPLASFIMPIMGAIAYTHYCLGQLVIKPTDGLNQ